VLCLAFEFTSGAQAAKSWRDKQEKRTGSRKGLPPRSTEVNSRRSWTVPKAFHVTGAATAWACERSEPGPAVAVADISALPHVVGRRVNQSHRDPLARIDRSTDYTDVVVRDRTNLL
jgi:hypothetical protein